MKSTEVQTYIHGTDGDIEALIDKHVEKVCFDRAADKGTSNFESHFDYEMGKLAASLLFWQQVKKIGDSKTALTKNDIDIMLTENGIDVSVLGGETKSLWDGRQFLINKRRNKDTEQVSAKDLVVQLRKYGVNPATIQKAMDAAKKTRKGNTYYDVVAKDV